MAAAAAAAAAAVVVADVLLVLTKTKNRIKLEFQFSLELTTTTIVNLFHIIFAFKVSKYQMCSFNVRLLQKVTIRKMEFFLDST